jgi:hypothetical protein
MRPVANEVKCRLLRVYVSLNSSIKNGVTGPRIFNRYPKKESIKYINQVNWLRKNGLVMDDSFVG